MRLGVLILQSNFVQKFIGYLQYHASQISAIPARIIMNVHLTYLILGAVAPGFFDSDRGLLGPVASLWRMVQYSDSTTKLDDGKEWGKETSH